jgi:hypothetical protein
VLTAQQAGNTNSARVMGFVRQQWQKLCQQRQGQLGADTSNEQAAAAVQPGHQTELLQHVPHHQQQLGQQEPQQQEPLLSTPVAKEAAAPRGGLLAMQHAPAIHGEGAGPSHPAEHHDKGTPESSATPVAEQSVELPSPAGDALIVQPHISGDPMHSQRDPTEEARKQHTALVGKLLHNLGNVPTGSWLSEEKRDLLCEALISLQYMDPQTVSGSITVQHVEAMERQVVQQKYSSAISLVDGLLKVVAAMLVLHPC